MVLAIHCERLPCGDVAAPVPQRRVPHINVDGHTVIVSLPSDAPPAALFYERSRVTLPRRMPRFDIPVLWTDQG